ncbi:MAG: putative nucleic-acid-binding protein implicated in transcription termination [Deltaproteobacteria bacterium]|nr:putative nucleic-acid-binding protein implicated in transcription termination [Deltaproteobacteria bacterium]
MSQKGQVPVRMCIGCRAKRKKEEMIWLAESPAGVAVVNGKKPHQGRGFYLCPNLRCLNMAKKKRKGIGFLETMDFRFSSAKGFGEDVKGVGYGR